MQGGPLLFYGSGGPTAPAGLNYRKGGLWWRMKGASPSTFCPYGSWGPYYSMVALDYHIVVGSKKPGAIPRSPREWGKGGLNLALFYEHIICSIRLKFYGLVGGV